MPNARQRQRQRQQPARRGHDRRACSGFFFGLLRKPCMPQALCPLPSAFAFALRASPAQSAAAAALSAASQLGARRSSTSTQKGKLLLPPPPLPESAVRCWQWHRRSQHAAALPGGPRCRYLEIARDYTSGLQHLVIRLVLILARIRSSALVQLQLGRL